MYTFDAPEKKNSPPPVLRRTVKESPFNRSKGIQATSERALRSIAREVGKLIKGYSPDDPVSEQSLNQALKSYSEIIGPWALHVVNNVIQAVDSQDKFAWRQHSKNMSLALRNELQNAPVGDTVKDLFQQNVTLIKSIPLQAAERVHKLIQENMMQSKRASDVAKKIMETEYVTKNRATLIARTEIAKASLALTQARALYVGSDGYIWHTSGDLIVRKSHRAMNGKFCRWDSPPLINEGTDEKPNMIAHGPGEIWNCRCFPEPILPDI